VTSPPGDRTQLSLIWRSHVTDHVTGVIVDDSAIMRVISAPPPASPQDQSAFLRSVSPLPLPDDGKASSMSINWPDRKIANLRCPLDIILNYSRFQGNPESQRFSWFATLHGIYLFIYLFIYLNNPNDKPARYSIQELSTGTGESTKARALIGAAIHNRC